MRATVAFVGSVGHDETERGGGLLWVLLPSMFACHECNAMQCDMLNGQAELVRSREHEVMIRCEARIFTSL